MIIRVKNPRRAEIFISSGRHTAKEVRALTGADVVVNGGLYDMKTMVPNCHLRVKGIDYARDPYNYIYGYGWSSGTARLQPVESRNKATMDYYVCCSWMVTGGKAIDMVYNEAQGGKRGNTAIGVAADGSIILNVHQDITGQKITPEEMQQEMIDAGCVTALRLDGGGSSQLNTSRLDIPSSIGRKVHNYICIWGEIEEAPKTEEEDDVYKIALSAGHGIKTAGKRCLKSLDPNETREWWLNDRICDLVESYLKDYEGYELLRLDDSDDGADDVALKSRTDKANAFGADVYISVHHNAGANGTNAGGIVTYSYPGSADGAALRDKLYDKLIELTGLKGNRYDGTQTANFYVLKYTKMTAVLLELGFMDSKVDVSIILSNDYAKKCAKAIVDVLVAEGGLIKKESTDDGLWRVQLGAFSKKENAEALAAKLEAIGYKPYITKY